MTEPFATLLDRNLLIDLGEYRTGRRSDTPEAVRERSRRPFAAPAVLANSFVCRSKRTGRTVVPSGLVCT